MAKSPEFPLPPSTTRILGIHQSDIILKSALDLGLADLRANPWLLDYVFASLSQDVFTANQFGQKLINEAKAWFLRTNVEVVVGPVLTELDTPRISIVLSGSQEVEAEATTSDTHYEPFEENDRTWPTLADLKVASWNPTEGLLTLVDGTLPDEVYIGAGMAVVDSTGKAFEIQETNGTTTINLAPNSPASFKGTAALKPRRPAWITAVESSSFRETYRLGVHVAGEPGKALWLHSIVVFILLRYKELLLEGRGFERSTFSSTDLAEEPQMQGQPIYGRYVSITGYVRQYWPKAVTPRIDVVQMTEIKVGGAGSMWEAGVDPETQTWVGDLDSISVVKRK